MRKREKQRKENLRLKFFSHSFKKAEVWMKMYKGEIFEFYAFSQGKILSNISNNKNDKSKSKTNKVLLQN